MSDNHLNTIFRLTSFTGLLSDRIFYSSISEGSCLSCFIPLCDLMNTHIHFKCCAFFFLSFRRGNSPEQGSQTPPPASGRNTCDSISADHGTPTKSHATFTLSQVSPRTRGTAASKMHETSGQQTSGRVIAQQCAEIAIGSCNITPLAGGRERDASSVRGPVPHPPPLETLALVPPGVL